MIEAGRKPRCQSVRLGQLGQYQGKIFRDEIANPRHPVPLTATRMMPSRVAR